MLARAISRPIGRTVQAPIRLHITQVRFVNVNQSEKKQRVSRGVIGVVGGALLLAVGYSYNHYPGGKSMPSAAESAKAQLERLSQDIPANAPASNHGLPWLRSTATSYAAFIPGAKAFIDSEFDEFEAIQQKHGTSIDEIVRVAHRDLSDATKNGLDLESVEKAWIVIENATTQISNLTAESTNDIFGQHPDIKAKVGGKLDQLKNMAENFGPEARRELEDVYQKIKSVLSAGLNSNTAEKIRKLIQDKIQTVEKFGDVAWERGMEEARPCLDKNPKIKVILEENKDNLKHGDLAVLWDKVKSAASSGTTEPVQTYLRDVQERRRQG